MVQLHTVRIILVRAECGVFLNIAMCGVTEGHSSALMNIITVM